MKNKEQPRKSTLQRRSGLAEGVFYSGYAASLSDNFGEVVIIAKDLDELIRRRYSMTDAELSIREITTVAIFSEQAVKLKDSGDSGNDIAEQCFVEGSLKKKEFNAMNQINKLMCAITGCIFTFSWAMDRDINMMIVASIWTCTFMILNGLEK